MKRFFFWGLCSINLGLAVCLVQGLGSQSKPPIDTEFAETLTPVGSETTGEPDFFPQKGPLKPGSRAELAGSSQRSDAVGVRPGTPFTTVYTPDLKQFSANLRKVNCPEETVRDILITAVHERYRAEEEALRPTPADHVPLTWSANTSERKLVERRLKAAALARNQSAVLSEALGYTMCIAPPTYALRDSDLKFEQVIAGFTPEQQQAARLAHEAYWQNVLELHDRAKGFWQSTDIVELEQLKAQRQQALVSMLNSAQR